ncbi:putative mitotic checkpoint protein BUB3 [Pisolithus thermaeus]|nr:putative mitotic checkpoint protein BUB3 [Pisolithus thermaeus]
MASRPFHIYDIRKIESSLTFMTRSLACMSDGKGYAIGSVEGRIGEEYFDPSSEVQDQKYAFKCHRQTIEDVDHAWPVDSLAFHAVHNTFASAGSDETVSIWDRKLKKRLHQYPKYSGPIASVAFSCDGSRLAVVVSYTWDDGEEALTIVEAYYMFII